jgi:hypothetical protein
VEPATEPVDLDDVPELNALEPHRIKGTRRFPSPSGRLDAVDPARVDDERKAALWLYAEVLVERRDEAAVPIDAELALS